MIMKKIGANKLVFKKVTVLDLTNLKNISGGLAEVANQPDNGGVITGPNEPVIILSKPKGN